MKRVVKIGGNALANPEWLAEFSDAASRASDGLVIVHGGGPDITELSNRLGVEVRWSNGRRVTTPESLDLAIMVLSGRTNKRLVRALISAGADAIGLSGEDGGLLQAVPAEGGAIGLVGEIVRVRTDLIESLLSGGYLPVISPLSRGDDGGALNVNADDAATAVATALGAAELLFVTDVERVWSADGRPIEVLDVEQAAAMVADGTARDGMSVKLNAAIRAIEAGVKQVRVGSVAMLVDPSAGTVVRAGSEVVA